MNLDSITSNADPVDCNDSPGLQPGQRGTFSGYALPADAYKDWAGCQARGYVLTARQTPVVQAVGQALAEGLYYTNDVLARCAELLQPTAEQRAVQAQRVEGGEFGMDCHYARRYLDAVKEQNAMDASAAALALTVGQKIGVLVFNDYKRTTGCTVEAVAECGRAATLIGKRGAHTVRIEATALQIQYAQQRAAERKARRAAA